MKFETMTIGHVKSIAQRSLLWRWSELAGIRNFPALDDFQMDSRMLDPKSFMMWNVECNHEGQKQFRVRYQGGRLKQALHGDWTGKTMDELVPKSIRLYAVETAERCADSGHAVFSILSTIDDNGQRVDCERLLLPFGRARRVEQIVATMQLISLKGCFDRSTVLNNYQKCAVVEIAGCIAAGFKRPNHPHSRAAIEQDLNA